MKLLTLYFWLQPAAGTITGTVRDKNDNPAARTVLVYDRNSRALVREVQSAADTGVYLAHVPELIPYDLRFAGEPGENDLCATGVLPDALPGGL
jgi:hypothetical protein